MQFQLILRDGEEMTDRIVQEDDGSFDTLRDLLAYQDVGNDIDTRLFTMIDDSEASEEVREVYKAFYGDEDITGEQLAEWSNFCLFHDDKDQDLVLAYILSQYSGQSASDIISDMDSPRTTSDLSIVGPHRTEEEAWEARGRERAECGGEPLPEWLKPHINFQSLGESMTDVYGTAEFCGQWYTYDSTV